jgi:hypothetical protein
MTMASLDAATRLGCRSLCEGGLDNLAAIVIQKVVGDYAHKQFDRRTHFQPPQRRDNPSYAYEIDGDSAGLGCVDGGLVVRGSGL